MMKTIRKHLISVLLIVVVLVSLSACGSSGTAESSAAPVDVSSWADTAPVDLDLTVLSSTMVYAEVYNMLYNDPESYLGKTVRARGEFSIYQLVVDGVLQPAPAAYDCIIADAIAKVPKALIDGMPNLKLIHSEGVAYNGIDLVAAAERGIPVCNCKGMNAKAVAEQAVLLMLALLRTLIPGDEAVRQAKQIEMKQRRMVEGIDELGDVTVGIIGLGDIGQATAKLLDAFGTHVLYYNPHRKSEQIERECHVTYLPEDELLAQSDIVSLHMPVTPETVGSIDAEFIGKMKPGSYLINTARGELVDQEALCQALVSGHLAGAGLDTLAPEPVTADNPLLNLPSEAASKVVFSPHLGGITQAFFFRAHKLVWENIARVAAGDKPVNIVNGL